LLNQKSIGRKPQVFATSPVGLSISPMSRVKEDGELLTVADVTAMTLA
jgi:hypothetical protein